MIIETLSTFPECFDSYMNSSIMARAQKSNKLIFKSHNLRDWTKDKHRSTDDEIYGGGQGLLMMCEPIFNAIEDLKLNNIKPYIVFFAPWGKQFKQSVATKLSKKERLILVCGHYEGIDERAYELADAIYSIGDYVLTGGEIAAMVITDAITRLLPGVLGNVHSAEDESFSDYLLEYPQYTRPANFKGKKVPEVLLSGDHAKIAKWRREQSIIRTSKLRPDLLKKANPDSNV